MTRSTSHALNLKPVLCSALPLANDGEVPEWVHLLPSGAVQTIDGRGPYKVRSMALLAQGAGPTRKLPLDECHSTDKAAPLGLPAPARGWIVEMQARDDGLWGRVEWTEEGRRLMADKAYAGISPVITHNQDKTILAVLRASLTNTPNLVGLTALHSEEASMDWKTKLIELLGLDSEADDAAIEAALSAKMNPPAKELCSEDVLSLPAVVALQSQVADLTTQLNSVQEVQSRKDAVAFVDGAIAEGRVGLKPVRDEYIALHMKDADQAKKLIGAMPVLNGSTRAGNLVAEDGSTSLDAVDQQVMALFGVEEETYAAGLSARGQKKAEL